MNTNPIEPADLHFNEAGLPWSPIYGDIYHPESGALAQAAHVFLAGNGLPARWQSLQSGEEDALPGCFTILEIGFGLGNNFLATWQAWRDTPEPKRDLEFISLEKHPLRLCDLQQVHAHSPLQPLATQLHAQWPPLTPQMHSLQFEGGRLRLMLGLGDALEWLPKLETGVDAFYLDGFAPSKNPQLWQPPVFQAMARLARVGATVATWSAARALREGLQTAGFEVNMAPGQGGKRHITLARYRTGH